MIQIMIMLHLLVAVTLLGVVTHQAFSVMGRAPVTAPLNIVNRYRKVHSPTFTNAIIILFVTATILGGLLYPRYRLDVRSTLEDLQLRGANGLFEIKEHFAAVGLGLLPAYWLFWQPPLLPEYSATRKYLTWLLAFIVWFNFLTGHYLNNIKGLYP